MTQILPKAKKISVTGGKGGTGKTLISVNLAVYYSQLGLKVLLVDSDVENPNSNILLGKELNDDDVKKSAVKMFVPEFSKDTCTKCGKCRDACYRHAIIQFPNQFPSVMDHMCSGCTTCQRICPTNAISAKYRIIGNNYYINNVLTNLDLIIGELNTSEAVSVLIVENLLDEVNNLDLKNEYDLIITDTAPGAHCDVEKALGEADLILCVTEPTPFGEHDLRRILDLIKLTDKKADIILNRSTLTDYKEPIQKISEEYNIHILGEIPIDPVIIEDYAKGVPFITDSREFSAKKSFKSILSRISEKINLEA